MMPRKEDEEIIERRIAMEGRFVKMETQINYLVENWENDKLEKATIAVDLKKAASAIEKRLTQIEHKIYLAIGAVAAAVFAIHWYFKY